MKYYLSAQIIYLKSVFILSPSKPKSSKVSPSLGYSIQKPKKCAQAVKLLAIGSASNDQPL
jgi:hypothetical protein